MCMEAQTGDLILDNISSMLEKQSGEFKQTWTKDAIAYLETLPKDDVCRDEETPAAQDEEGGTWVPFLSLNDRSNANHSPISQKEMEMFFANIDNSLELDFEDVELSTYDNDDDDDDDDDADDTYKYTRFTVKTSEDVKRDEFLGILNPRSIIDHEPANKKKTVNHLGYRLQLPGSELSVCLKTSSGIGQYILDTIPDFIDRNSGKRVNKSRVHAQSLEENVRVMPYIKYGDDTRSPELVLVLTAMKDMDAGTPLCARSSISHSNPKGRQAYLAETIINIFSDTWKRDSMNLGDIDEATNSGSVENTNSGSEERYDGSGDSGSTDSAQGNPDDMTNLKDPAVKNVDSAPTAITSLEIRPPSVKSDTVLKSGAGNAHRTTTMTSEEDKRKRDVDTADDGDTKRSKRSRKASERPASEKRIIDLMALSEMLESVENHRANDIYTEVREKAMANAASQIEALKVSLTNQKRTLSTACSNLRKIVLHHVYVADGEVDDPAKVLKRISNSLSTVISYIDGNSKKKTKRAKADS